MSQTAIIPCIGGTFLSFVNPNADNSNLTEIPTTYVSRYELRDDISKIPIMVAAANKDDTTQGSDHYDFGVTLLEFEDSQLLHGWKNIISASLTATFKGEAGPHITDPDDGALNPYVSTGFYVEAWPYYTTALLSNINLNNYKNVGEIQRYPMASSMQLYSGATTLTDVFLQSNNPSLQTKLNIALENIPTEYTPKFLVSCGIESAFSQASYFAYMCAQYTKTGDPDAYIRRIIDIDETYITIVYEDRQIQTPTPLTPIDTGFSQNQPITFSWRYNTETPATQTGATIQYRERGSLLWIEEEIVGSSTSWTLAAGLTTGQYEWRVCVENSLGETSSYCETKYFQVVAQSAPTPLAPGDNITLFEGHDITFTWLYNSLTPATQESATIKYRVIGGSTWTTYTSASANPFCTISDIPQGQYEWCLNITNNYGETSADSSTLEFNIIGRPQRPIILTPDNCCLTTISWNASGQEAAEFILMQGDDVLIHETVATAVTSYKPQIFLKGTYKAMARIKNNSDLWSDYGELEFTIDAAAPDAGVLVAIPYDTEIHLEGTYTSENAAIVRIDEDGTENVLSMTASAVDKKVASGLEYAYVLRCWNSGGYVDTPTKVFTFNFPGSIFTTDTEELHLDRSEQKFIAHDEDVERQYAAMRYVGREYAVIERGEYTEQTLAKQFHVTKAQRKILDRLAKEKALFYRDSRGNAFKAAILGVSYNGYMDDAYIASIKLTRTAADEVIINV